MGNNFCECFYEPLLITQGASCIINVPVTNSDGSVYSLSGVTSINFNMRQDKSVIPACQLALGSGITITSPSTAGIFIVNIPSTITAILTAGTNYAYELFLTDASGNILPVANGQAIILPYSGTIGPVTS